MLCQLYAVESQTGRASAHQRPRPVQPDMPNQSKKTFVTLAHSPERECEDNCRNGESIQAKKTPV